MNKFKNFINSSYGKVSTGLIVATAPIMTFASDTPSISSTVTASIQTVVTDTIATIAAVAPIGITVFGAMFVWKKGIKFFKGISG